MYQVEVTREGRWWMVAVPQIGGLTQARRLAEAELMAREYIAATTGTALEDVQVQVHVGMIGDVDVPARLARIRAEREEAARIELTAAEETKALVAELTNQGVPLRDIGSALGISYQRAHQLTQV